jgi:hypothetical protein
MQHERTTLLGVLCAALVFVQRSFSQGSGDDR